MNYTADAEETRKKITTLLLDGASVINVDDIPSTSPFRSEPLATAITRTMWNDRLLGKNQLITVPNLATWVGNGRNLQLGGDMVRRCYRIRLEPKVPCPWKREDFWHDPLLPWVLEKRGEILAALLTMARAWFAAGKPPGPKRRFGSFQEWTDTVGGILHFCGINGFLQDQDSMRDDQDSEASQWENFLSVVSKRFGSARFSVAAVHKVLKKQTTLLDCLPDELAEVYDLPERRFKLRLGWAFKRVVGVRFSNGLVVLRTNEPDAKVAEWVIERFKGE